jgi:hypothetical protein
MTQSDRADDLRNRILLEQPGDHGVAIPSPGANYEEDRRLHAADSRNLIVK